MDIQELKKSINIAEELDDQELARIGSRVKSGYELDEESRADWQDLVDKAMDIAKQTMDQKNHPFPNASNVKYPLITQAAIDFAARTYPELIQNDRIVHASVMGLDQNGEKEARATRVSRHMSHQLLKESEEWEDGVDKMLHILPVLGTVFKKTYYNPVRKKIVSELCNPDKIVVNYSTQSLETASRVTHILTMSSNDIIERVRAGLYLDVDVDKMSKADGFEEDDDAPLELLEQHCFLDLDEDGYKEPYIVTVHKESGQVLRIMQRFKEVKKNAKGEVMTIEAEQYFTDFHFIRSPDGGFYSVGLGTLLYPLNSAINTLINQLIDAGTLNNTQGGFLGRGLRLKNGEMKLKLGEWKVLDAAAGQNLAQNIVPVPTKEPSPALFQLLGLLINVGKDIIAANDVMQGKGQTQNVAATTVLAMVEQGMKVFNAISKRMYRSLKKEYKKIFDLTGKFGDKDRYRMILDDPKANLKEDYNSDDMDIYPVADPAMSSQVQRLAKAQAVMQLPTLDPHQATRFYLEALQFDEAKIAQLLPPKDPNAPPPPESQKIMAEIQKIGAESRAKLAEASVLSEKNLFEVEKTKLLKEDVQTRAQEAAMRIIKMQSDMKVNEAKVELAGAKADQEAMIGEFKTAAAVSLKGKELEIKATEAKDKSDGDTRK